MTVAKALGRFLKAEIWSCRWGLNPWSPHYQCGALPLSYGSLRPRRGMPAVSGRSPTASNPLHAADFPSSQHDGRTRRRLGGARSLRIGKWLDCRHHCNRATVLRAGGYSPPILASRRWPGVAAMAGPSRAPFGKATAPSWRVWATGRLAASAKNDGCFGRWLSRDSGREPPLCLPSDPALEPGFIHTAPSSSPNLLSAG